MGELFDMALGPLKLKAWLGILVVLAGIGFIVIRIADNAVEDTLDTARDAGAGEAVIAGQQTTFQQNKDANDAEDNLRRGGERSAERYQQCLLDTRRPAGCERFRPGQQQPVPD